MIIMKQKEAWEYLFKKDRLEWTIPDVSVVNLVPLLKKRNFKRTLDLGCGSGRHMVYLGKRNFVVVGSDISPTGLSRAQKWLEKENIDNYCLVEHDMIKLPFPDEHFDVVVGINVIHHNHLKKIKQTVNEINRVLKKKGLVLVTLSSTGDYKFGIGKKLERNTYLSPKGAIHHFFDEKGVRKLFDKFKIIDIKERVEVKNKKSLAHLPILKNIKKRNVTVVHWQVLAERL